MEISQLEIFAQVGQLYAENTILKRQVNELASENQQLRSQLQPNIGTAVERASTDAPVEPEPLYRKRINKAAAAAIEA